MTIELVYRKQKQFPTPYITETNEVELNLLDYMVFRNKYPNFIPTKTKKKRNAQPPTIVQATKRIAYLINQLAEQIIEVDGTRKVGIDYRQATYEENMVPIIEAMRLEWVEESIEQYVKDWRNFFRFLTAMGIDHSMFMPDTIVVETPADLDNNFLSHTNHSHKSEVEQETAIDPTRKHFKSDHADDVISMEDFWDIYAALYEQDEVYAVMAYCELVTLLRVSGLVRDFPLSATKMNPDFKPYMLARREGIEMQELHYIAKGGKEKTTQFPIMAHKIFHEEYINSPVLNYQKRLQKYRNIYCKTKFAAKHTRTPEMQFTWLNANGTPVSVREYQKAFEKVSESLGINVHSHTLRHTGATQLCWRYLKETNQTASHTNALLVSDVHIILQAILGHEDVETTKRYIKTIERMIQSEQGKMILNSALSISYEHHQELMTRNKALSNGLSALERALKNHEEFMTGKK